MRTILLVVEEFWREEQLCQILDLDKISRLITVNIRQINSKNIKTLRQADLILVEKISNSSELSFWENVLTLLESTGIPLMLLPTISSESGFEEKITWLNGQAIASGHPDLSELIDQIQSRLAKLIQTRSPSVGRFSSQADEKLSQTDDSFKETAERVHAQDGRALSHKKAQPIFEKTDQKSPISSKVFHCLRAIEHTSNKLREPLSNMNLAIHMLGKVSSTEERDRYVKLLREEYQRELQLLNELEALRLNLETLM